MTTNSIEIKNVSKKYKDFYAVKEASLSIEQGKIYGLVGKNGAGKTTLFKLILGLSNQSEGAISINGSTTKQELLNERAHIGFYIGPNFYDYLNAEQNLEYYRKLKGISDKGEIDRVLKIAGLYGEKKKYKAFSMGMKQRLGIANALLGDPDIIILDEPINGLDPQGILEIRNLLKSLNTEHNKTLIVSSHILSELDLVAHTFGIIDHGVFLKQLNKNEFSQNEQAVLKISTSNNALALEILEKNYAIKTATLDDQYFLASQERLSSEMLSSLLFQGIELNEIVKQSKSLEDYYFELTGGQ
ncbi:MAG: ABC transporter ATP-binding protein [Erysipelothrix sp.]|nr:ABC transporter ATP-binding protein [Erysipelothrix sp.]